MFPQPAPSVASSSYRSIPVLLDLIEGFPIHLLERLYLGMAAPVSFLENILAVILSHNEQKLISRCSVLAFASARSAASQPYSAFLDSSSITWFSAASLTRTGQGSLPSTGITRLHRYYEPLRHLRPPMLALAGSSLKSDSQSQTSFAAHLPHPPTRAVKFTPVESLVAVSRSLHW